MTRDQALEELKNDPYDEKMMTEDKEYIAKKLGITVREFDDIIGGENKTYRDYKNSYRLFEIGAKVLRKTGAENKLYR
jgi:hypothetical protein